MTNPTCALNRCTREQGSGTWAGVLIDSDWKTIPVCEEHWQALRVIHPEAAHAG